MDLKENWRRKLLPVAEHRSVILMWLLLIWLNGGSGIASVAAFEDLGPSFRNEVMAVLSRSGCNLGTCHGSANGKGGLKLSLRGQDPGTDFETLTRQFSARRVNQMNPDESLLLQKPLMTVPHEGGRRFLQQSNEYRILKEWIAAGIPGDFSKGPKLTQLKVVPQYITVEASDQPVQLHATAVFSDGSQRDVTNLAVYDSSSLNIPVSRDGAVSASDAGLTTVTVRYLDLQQPVRLEVVAVRPDFHFQSPAPQNAIDQHVFAQLQRLRINPSEVCDDRVFLRRAWLDLTGQLPPADVAKEFLQSEDAGKRLSMINRLLASSEFVDQQTMRWADLLRAEEKTLDSTGLAAYHAWIRNSVEVGKPLNQMAAELIAARGSTYKVAETNFYRAMRTPEERAESTAQLFLGIRLTCAKCHNHPFDRWTQDDYYNWSNFFGRIDYEIVENKRRDKNDKHEFVGEQIVKIKPEGEVRNVRTGKPAQLSFLGDAASPITETAEQDRLQLLARWLSDPANQRFAATQANRIWFQLMGRGVVDPVDDFRSTNPPVNAELLDTLTSELINSNYDTRHLMRMIMSSAVYQLASQTNDTNLRDELCFSHVSPQRLTAEQMLDAISIVVGAPVLFGGHPAGTRATQLVGVRNGEFRYAKPERGDDFLKLFGRPNRLQSCECERSNDPTLAQTFEMVSGNLMTQMLGASDNRITRAIAEQKTPTVFLDELYWAALSRSPTVEELDAFLQYAKAGGDQKAVFEDITWAVLNSNEFLLRH